MIASFLFFLQAFLLLSFTFCTTFRKNLCRGQTHPPAHKASDSSHRCSYWPTRTLKYADTHSHSTNVCGSVSLWLITVCSPPQMPAQDQETMVRLLTSSFSSALTPHALLFNVFLCTHCLPLLTPCL